MRLRRLLPAVPLLNFYGGQQGAVRYESGQTRLIYASFGFEGIDSVNPNTAGRALVLRHVLDWLLGNSSSGNYAPVPIFQVEQTILLIAPDTFKQVTLDGSASYDVDGTVMQYQWFDGTTPLGTDPVITVPLAFGKHQITLTTTDNLGKTGTATVQVSVLQQLFADDMSTSQPWFTQGTITITQQKPASIPRPNRPLAQKHTARQRCRSHHS